MLVLPVLLGEYACCMGLVQRLPGEGVNSGVKGNSVKPIVEGDADSLVVVSRNIGRDEKADWEENVGSVWLEGDP